MKIPRLLILITLVLTLTSTPITVAEDASAPQPTPEHKELEMWIGSWTGSGEMKPGPFGPGGPMQWAEVCSRFGGSGFHVICNSTGTAPTGPMQGLGILGYHPGKKVYTHYGIDNSGWAGLSDGTRSGDSWTFESEDTMEGKTYHSRFTIMMNSPTEMKFTLEMSEDGKSWTGMMEGISKKK